MKSTLYKIIAALLCLGAALSLSGCAGLYANVREVEDLLVIQTLGLDGDPAGVRLTLASGAGAAADDAPLRLEGRGPSVTAALEQIRSRANEEDLFCAHISHVLIGESAARAGLEAALAYICRSQELRISVPLYVLRGQEAGEAVLRVGSEKNGICDALDSVNGDVKLRGDGHVTTASELAADLARQGSGLVCAVALQPSAEQPSPQKSAGEEAREAFAAQSGDEEPLLTVAAAGYGVVKDGKLCAWIDRARAVAVGLLKNQSGPCELTVTEGSGETVTLTLERGESALRPVWGGDGRLVRLDVQVRSEATLAERGGEEGLAARADEEELCALAEAALSERLGAVLQLSKELRADFLGLGSRLERAEPARFRPLLPAFPELLADLPIRLSVRVTLTHTNDVEDLAP